MGEDGDFKEEKKYPVRLGNTFQKSSSLNGRTRAPQTSYQTLTYDFIPGSMKTDEPGLMQRNSENALVLQFESKTGSNKCVFTGSTNPSSKTDCVLIFDGQSFRLEKVSSNSSVKHVTNSSSIPLISLASVGVKRKTEAATAAEPNKKVVKQYATKNDSPPLSPNPITPPIATTMATTKAKATKEAAPTKLPKKTRKESKKGSKKGRTPKAKAKQAAAATTATSTPPTKSAKTLVDDLENDLETELESAFEDADLSEKSAKSASPSEEDEDEFEEVDPNSVGMSLPSVPQYLSTVVSVPPSQIQAHQQQHQSSQDNDSDSGSDSESSSSGSSSDSSSSSDSDSNSSDSD